MRVSQTSLQIVSFKIGIIGKDIPPFSALSEQAQKIIRLRFASRE
jgi:hypothetical protein